jgi:pyruvate-formate lyase
MKTKYIDFERDQLDMAVCFTERYRETEALNKTARELACLEIGYTELLMGPESRDLFAGRTVVPIAGFTNLMYPEGDPSDAVGYFYDHHRAKRILQEQGLEGSPLAQKIDEISAFWKGHTSYRVINDAMDEAMRMVLPSRRYTDESAVCHRLGRIASPSMDYTSLLELGVPGFRARLVGMKERSDSAGRQFFDGGIGYIDLFVTAMEAYRKEFARLAARESGITRRHELNRVAQTMATLQEREPQTFFEAVQLVHLFNVCGYCCDSLGRLDDLYGPYLVRDLESGLLTEDEAVRQLVSLWQLNDERFINTRLTIGGEGRQNPAEADVFCRLAMEATRRYFANGEREIRHPGLQISLSPQLSFRVSRETPRSLRDQALDVIASGATFPVIYNDDINIPSVANAFRIPIEDAQQYTFFDCGEYLIHGKSIGTPSCIINLPKALEVALHNGVDPRSGRRLGPHNPDGETFQTFESVWEAYHRQVEFSTRQSARYQKLVFDQLNTCSSFIAMSLMMPACLDAGRGILDGGCEMLGGTYETYGNITAADALFAIRKAVYEDGLLSIEELIAQQDADFADRPDLKKQLLAFPKFGNDLDEVDAMAQRVSNHICTITRDQADLVGLHHFLVVVINNQANVQLGAHVNATADGRASGDPMTNGHTPTPGMDVSGITALVNSILKLPADLHAGAVHNLRFSRHTIEQCRSQVEAVLGSYLERGGTQCMITVTSREELEEARKHPENYGHLMVRVGGFSSVFVSLPPALQQEIINRTAY